MLLSKTLKIILVPAILAISIFVFRAEVGELASGLQGRLLPCGTPVAYSIGSFDNRFGISEENFLAAVRQAEQIWEKPAGKELFAYAPDGALKINLIYDHRQEATAKLEQLGIVAGGNKASYDALKAKYNSMLAAYSAHKAAFDSRVSAFEARQDSYNEEVARWNSRGGAPSSVYARLSEEKNTLNAEVAVINQLQDDLNAEAENINAVVVALNRLAAELDIYNAEIIGIGQSQGAEFEEGVYKSDPSGEKIEIYQFDSSQRLVRVLAHELGHALGLEHIDDPKAIMYRLNQSLNEKPTAADILELNKHCGPPLND